MDEKEVRWWLAVMFVAVHRATEQDGLRYCARGYALLATHVMSGGSLASLVDTSVELQNELLTERPLVDVLAGLTSLATSRALHWFAGNDYVLTHLVRDVVYAWGLVGTREEWLTAKAAAQALGFMD